MRQILIITALLFIALTSCDLQKNIKEGNGQPAEREKSVDSFEAVSIDGNFKIILVKDAQERVTIKADENLLAYINLEVHKKQLNINTIHNLKPTNTIEITIYYNSLNKLKCGGAASIAHKEALINDELEIDLTGTGLISMDIDVKKLHVQLSGAGVIELGGDAEVQEVFISGAGAYQCKSLKSENASVELTGIGNAEILAHEELDAEITGLGKITYYGQPAIIDKKVTGMGKIEQGTDFVD